MAGVPGPVSVPAELPHACRELRAFLDDPRLPVGYDPQFREYWMPVVVAPGQAAVRQLFVFCLGGGVLIARADASCSVVTDDDFSREDR